MFGDLENVEFSEYIKRFYLLFQSGDTPLMRAVRSRNAEMVQLLLEKKVRVNVADNRGDTVLHIAMRARSKVKLKYQLHTKKNKFNVE